MYIGCKIREERGLSRQDLSRLSGVPYRTLEYWEKGLRKASDVHQLKKVADVLNVKIEDLIDWGKLEP